MPRNEPSFSCAARLSTLKESTPNSATGKRVVLPLPGGPATMTIRGRAKLSPEVSVCVLTHIFGEFGLQEVATLIDDAFADHFSAFCLGDLGAGCKDLSGESV